MTTLVPTANFRSCQIFIEELLAEKKIRKHLSATIDKPT